MRVTPEILLKIARDTVAKRTRSDRDLLSIYLTGSLLHDDPLLGGTADIDLVFVHDESPITSREIQPLNDEVHLDIAHHARSDYRQTRSLRLHPWLGPTISRCKPLFDPHHFMDFTQASVRGQFNRPDYVLGRAQGQAEHARQMWLSLHNRETSAGIAEVNLYLRAVEHAVNAIASLSGPPLPERRLLLNFPARAEAAGHPGLYPGLLGLLGAPNTDLPALQSWLTDWQQAYEAIPASAAPPRLHPDRCLYYLRAFEKITGGAQPQDILWPLLRTWTSAVQQIPPGHPAWEGWQAALERLGVLGEGFAERVTALDAYLDSVEEALEEWARANGAE